MNKSMPIGSLDSGFIKHTYLQDAVDQLLDMFKLKWNYYTRFLHFGG